jgi:hypothetical protein
MEQVTALPYNGYEIMVYKDNVQFFFTIAKGGRSDDLFFFAVPRNGTLSLPFDEALFDEQIQICKDHIDIITKRYLSKC